MLKMILPNGWTTEEECHVSPITTTNGIPQCRCPCSTYLCWRHARQSGGVSHSPPRSSSLQRSTPCAPPPQQHGWLSVALLLGAQTSATFHAQAPLWLPVLRPSLGCPPRSHQATPLKPVITKRRRSAYEGTGTAREWQSTRVQKGIVCPLGQELLSLAATADRLTSPIWSELGGYFKTWSTPTTPSTLNDQFLFA